MFYHSRTVNEPSCSDERKCKVVYCAGSFHMFFFTCFVITNIAVNQIFLSVWGISCNFFSLKKLHKEVSSMDILHMCLSAFPTVPSFVHWTFWISIRAGKFAILGCFREGFMWSRKRFSFWSKICKVGWFCRKMHYE